MEPDGAPKARARDEAAAHVASQGRLVGLAERFGGSAATNLVVGTSVEDRGSTFIAVAAFPVATQGAARATINLLRDHAVVIAADARVCAFRSCDGVEGSDDDGEANAGKQLLIALRKLKVQCRSAVVLLVLHFPHIFCFMG